MERSRKKKLMVVVGAGASVELGMPSVNEVDRLFSEWAKNGYLLANDEKKTLYCHIRDEVNRHYGLNPKKGLRKETNFEELLYVILQLSAALGDDNYSLPMNAFWGLKKLPKIKSYIGEKIVDGHDLRQLGYLLVDKLTTEFRDRCKVSKENNSNNFEKFQKFINQLNDDFDVAFITLNYDNLITQACPSLFTGFNVTSGSFDASSVYDRTDWGLIYHLHGSVHFDMQGEELNMHSIKWNSNLNSTFSGNSSGRNSQDTSEGISMPTSVIVAGYGKTNQIQRVPFRTYYSKIDEIAAKADAFLFLGYGFNDLHLNNALHSVRNGEQKKPVVIIDWASDDQDPMQFRNDEWSYNLCRTVFVNASEMATRKYQHAAPDISELKANGIFEVSSNPDYPLSIWYGGFIQACDNYLKIKDELEASN
ncbi:SIR2 family protein [Vibrio parahaemolyticus]|uniref:SIR2 family protein n=1 Tax=Vibrio parahaemolyticus TaxID=670 RepID=UPI0011EC1495|nr:SIR2 family protein [Vibrio parahaemolyticus]MCX4129383.1 SIR2 family protein [Vibrio parahaemolyticus]WHT08911.1 SIR2 family protein [Vibrio parahaemolyticus]